MQGLDNPGVNGIAPGTVDTAMRRKTVDNLPAEAQAELKAHVEHSYPLGRIGRPDDDLAGMAPYLASDEAAGPAARSLRWMVDIYSGVSTGCRPPRDRAGRAHCKIPNYLKIEFYIN
ncbi:SDR family oxidoreductase [Mesorhizobium erdmanii]|uniref:SDR family oxidoreductase n=1 Tax=Mesorhizobium erdmanii TaxID=1777866 RepID=UPI000414F146|nr:SDR family oxidoreductase [Mesorhizobium erdmanii]